MHRLLSRTSITIDEAVGILVGLISGPVDFDRSDGPEDVDADCPMFGLQEALENEMAVPASEYVMTKYEKQPPHVIAEKFAAQQRQEAMMERANYYKCAIADEINKGEQSVLKVDSALSNAAYTFITLHSFNEWVKSIGREGLADGQSGAAVSAVSSTVPVKGATTRPAGTKLRDQEDAILAEIRKEKKCDPKALPKNPSGKAGVKAAIRNSLKDSPLFEGATTFDKAWERLAKDGRIVHEA